MPIERLSVGNANPIKPNLKRQIPLPLMVDDVISCKVREIRLKSRSFIHQAIDSLPNCVSRDISASFHASGGRKHVEVHHFVSVYMGIGCTRYDLDQSGEVVG